VGELENNTAIPLVRRPIYLLALRRAICTLVANCQLEFSDLYKHDSQLALTSAQDEHNLKSEVFPQVKHISSFSNGRYTCRISVEVLCEAMQFIR
jgi:hypothetical protein